MAGLLRESKNVETLNASEYSESPGITRGDSDRSFRALGRLGLSFCSKSCHYLRVCARSGDLHAFDNHTFSRMAVAFSVASWNIEHFGSDLAGDRDPETVLSFLADQDPDVIGIYEVSSSSVFGPIMEAFPDHTFHITEGPQTQEILVGTRQGLPAFVTQKTTFKSGQSTLRPGVLLTVRAADAFYPILFLHLKSLPDPKGFGLRDDMMRRALRFRSVLNDAAGGRANYIFVGDLNTMGLDYPYKAHDIAAEDEIDELRRRTGYQDLRLLSKNAPHTWWNGTGSNYPPADLDHVVAAEHLEFTGFSGAEVDVRGWPKRETEAERTEWIQTHSDHGLLYFEVHEVSES